MVRDLNINEGFTFTHVWQKCDYHMTKKWQKVL